MSTTVKELSAKLKIKRTAIEMRMKQIPDFRKKYVTRQGNKLIISDKGASLICHLKGGNNTVNKHVKSTVNDTVNDLTVKSLRTQLRQANEHNSQLDSQLKNANSSNKTLEKLLDQQQQLQLSTVHENDQLKGQIKHLKEISGPTGTNTENDEHDITSQKSRPKKTFWQRLFGK